MLSCIFCKTTEVNLVLFVTLCFAFENTDVYQTKWNRPCYLQNEEESMIDKDKMTLFAYDDWVEVIFLCQRKVI
jgi:hypothetical protein